MTKSAHLPKISVLMPVYNGGPFLKETLDSLARQTFTNYELIVINDGSTDDSREIIDTYAASDDRIVAHHRKNVGLVETLNFGISLARSNLIARVDADDPSFDTRLEEQLKLFRSDTELVLVGGGFEIIDEDGYFIETIHPTFEDQDLRRALMLRNPFGHSGVMFKKDAVIAAGQYLNDFGPTEDFDLWIRLSKIGKLASVQKPIYRYRISRMGISQTNSRRQADETKYHIQKQWQESFPKVLSRRELLEKSRFFIRTTKRPSYGIGVKEQYLSDNAQIGIKLIRYKRYRNGLHQLFNVASTGRTGVRVIIKRFKSLDRGSLKQSRDL